MITQKELKDIERMADKAEKLAQESDVERAKLLARLEAKEEVEAGPFGAHIESSERRSVSWKAEFVKRLGDGLAKEIQDGTEPHRSFRAVVTKESK